VLLLVVLLVLLLLLLLLMVLLLTLRCYLAVVAASSCSSTTYAADVALLAFAPLFLPLLVLLTFLFCPVLLLPLLPLLLLLLLRRRLLLSVFFSLAECGWGGTEAVTSFEGCIESKNFYRDRGVDRLESNQQFCKLNDFGNVCGVVLTKFPPASAKTRHVDMMEIMIGYESSRNPLACLPTCQQP
jgi:predicted membrane protein